VNSGEDTKQSETVFKLFFVSWLKGVFMKKVVLWIILIACLIVPAGWGAKHSGRYVNQSSPEEYLELKPDGNFVLREIFREMSGTYKIEGTSLVLYVPLVSGGTELKTKVHYFQGVIKDNTTSYAFFSSGRIYPTPSAINRTATAPIIDLIVYFPTMRNS
jgi:hypothetical protein